MVGGFIAQGAFHLSVSLLSVSHGPQMYNRFFSVFQGAKSSYALLWQDVLPRVKIVSSQVEEEDGLPEVEELQDVK